MSTASEATLGGRDAARRRLVLIDDDPAFAKIMQEFARSRGIELDAFASLADMGRIGRFADYGAAIVDHDLGTTVDGVEVAEYLPSLFTGLAMVLISGRERAPTPSRPWPRSIAKFVHKDQGPDAILDAALTLRTTAPPGATGRS
jgi:DNA-binding NtrC family response regulator